MAKVLVMAAVASALVAISRYLLIAVVGGVLVVAMFVAIVTALLW